MAPSIKIAGVLHYVRSTQEIEWDIRRLIASIGQFINDVKFYDFKMPDKEQPRSQVDNPESIAILV